MKVVIEEYIPTLEEADEKDLLNFMLELFCTQNEGGVQND